jgi:hypothetical protein
MRNEMDLVDHLLYNTKIPVPEVLTFDATLDNYIGAPYCLMERLPGKPAQQLWYEDTKDRNCITANDVTAETETKRCNFLRSLARSTELVCPTWMNSKIPMGPTSLHPIGGKTHMR